IGFLRTRARAALALGVRKSSTAYRMASAAGVYRPYFSRFPLFRLPGTVLRGLCSRWACRSARSAFAEPLFVLKLFQCHRSERSSVADSPLRKFDDLPGNETLAADSITLGTEHQCGVTNT